MPNARGSQVTSTFPAAIIVAIAVVGLLIVPMVATPVAIIGGLFWRTGPKWARYLLVLAGALFVLYFVVSQPFGSPRLG